jgi:hypothetical protein
VVDVARNLGVPDVVWEKELGVSEGDWEEEVDSGLAVGDAGGGARVEKVVSRMLAVR